MFAGGVDQVQQHPATFDMAEKSVAEAGAFMRALDQAGNIGEHEFAPLRVHDAKLRVQRGEGIVGDLRFCRADDREEGRLAGIGQADEARVGDQLQPQPDPALFAFLARIGVARRAVGGGLEMRVAEAAIAAFGQHEFFAERGEVVDQRFAVLVDDLRADRHFQHDRFAVGPMAVAAHAIDALRSLEVLLIAIVDQRVEPVDHFDDDIAAATAIAAGRTAELDEFFAAERHAAVSAVAGADIDLGFIKKFHGSP